MSLEFQVLRAVRSNCESSWCHWSESGCLGPWHLVSPFRNVGIPIASECRTAEQLKSPPMINTFFRENDCSRVKSWCQTWFRNSMWEEIQVYWYTLTRSIHRCFPWMRSCTNRPGICSCHDNSLGLQIRFDIMQRRPACFVWVPECTRRYLSDSQSRVNGQCVSWKYRISMSCCSSHIIK